MAASAVLKNTVSIEEWVAAIKEAKNCALLLPHSNLQEKNDFGSQSFISVKFLYICQ